MGTSVEHDSGGTWTSSATPSTVSLTSLAAFSPSDVWAAGGEVTVHWNGTAWSNVSNAFTGAGINVSAIGGSGSSDVWAGGDNGYLMHWNGSSWGLPTTVAPSKAVRVSVPSGGAAMAAGAFGVVRWNGASWVNTTFTQSTQSVWAASATEAWALAYDSNVGGAASGTGTARPGPRAGTGCCSGSPRSTSADRGAWRGPSGRAGSSCTARNARRKGWLILASDRGLA